MILRSSGDFWKHTVASNTTSNYMIYEASSGDTRGFSGHINKRAWWQVARLVEAASRERERSNDLSVYTGSVVESDTAHVKSPK